jgi:predicted phosphate transport protein (TIGR00153 family)
MKNSIFNKFTPKEPKFFPLLKSLAHISDDAALQLIRCIESINSDAAKDIHQNIKDLEHKGDEITHKIFDELNSTFITPFDREDIYNLANRLDDVTDQIYGCSKRISFYNPKKLPSEALELAKLVKSATELMLHAVKELDVLKKNPKHITKYCIELHDIENQADEVFQTFIIRLFETEKDAVELIKLKEIINVLEGITDETDHVGKIIKNIIVKYA